MYAAGIPWLYIMDITAVIRSEAVCTILNKNKPALIFTQAGLFFMFHVKMLYAVSYQAVSFPLSSAIRQPRKYSSGVFDDFQCSE